MPLVTSSSNVIVKFKRVVRFSGRKKNKHEAQDSFVTWLNYLLQNIFIFISYVKSCVSDAVDTV